MTRSDQQLNRQPSMRVLERVAEAKGTDPAELTPLYSVVDPGALDALFDAGGDARTGTAHVAFSYEGYSVVVRSDGRVDISRETV